MTRPQGDMVQIHLLTAYPASLLNRDDVGLAKRMPFGGATRTRVSSQCLKKHWRESPLVGDLGDVSVRSARIYERLVAEHLVDELSATEEEAVSIAQFLMDATVDTKAQDSREGLEAARSGQLLVLTRAETDFLQDKASEILQEIREKGLSPQKPKDVKANSSFAKDKELKKTLKELKASVDTALFGRMVTSDLFARVDAAVSVAHAFTTHGEAAETDYFTAVDTLKGEADDAGAGLIQDTELTSGVFYLYAVIDMNQLRENLVGHETSLSERLGFNLVKAMATVSPGAKRGSTAPYAFAEFALLERGDAQPRTLANAFLEPVPMGGGNAMRASATALLDHRQKLSEMYGDGGLDAALATIHDVGDVSLPLGSLDEILARTFQTDS